jgi:membrane protein YqaA with SNARE-associated domain
MSSNKQKGSRKEPADELQNLREKQHHERKKITLFRSPVKTLYIFALVVLDWIKRSAVFLISHKLLLYLSIITISAGLAAYILPGPHQVFVESTMQVGSRIVWWVVLGVLSSIGLGTGLHTFVLYLGPFIAQVTLAATECKSTDIETYGPNRLLCPDEALAADPNAAVPGFAQIAQLVIFEAFLWGMGTAIGELPPYFVARAARLTEERLKQRKIDLLDEEEEGNGLVSRLKQFVVNNLGRLGFFGILLFASVPNPLFDLAGLTAGHLLVPFKTFFFATLIGKAIIKAVFVQSFLLVTVFSKDHLESVISLVERVLPFLKGKLQQIFDDVKKQYHHTAASETTKVVKKSNYLSLVWDVVLAVMISYFIVSLINSTVQEYLHERDEEELEKRKKK